jgi:hypothetical protein
VGVEVRTAADKALLLQRQLDVACVLLS